MKHVAVFLNWKFLAILLFSTNISNAQNIHEDPLQKQLSSATSDVERLDFIIENINISQDTDIDQSLKYLHNALALSRKLKDQEKEAAISFNIGLAMTETSKIDSSLIYFEASEQMADRLKLRELQSDNLMRIANWYRYHSEDSLQTVSYLQKSVQVSKAANYHYGTGRSYAKLASFYTKYKQIHLCKAYLKESATFYIQTKNNYRDIANYYNEVGNKIWAYNPKASMDFYFTGLNYVNNYPSLKVSLAKAYSTIGQPEEALKYLNEAIPLLSSKGKERSLGIALAQLAEVQLQLGNDQESLKIANNAISFLTPLSLGSHSSLPSLYRTLGRLKEKDGKEKSALPFYIKSLDKAIEINEAFEPVKMITMTVKSNIVLGNYYAQNTPTKGKTYCKKALENASKNHYANLEIEACDCLYNIYNAENNPVNALKYIERKLMLGDSLSTLKVEHALEVANKDMQLAEEGYQKERKVEQLQNQKTINAILGISLLLGCLLILFLTKSRRKISNQNLEISRKTAELEKANTGLARSNEDLERFAFVASHDLKTPLNTIITFSGLIKTTFGKDENLKAQEYLQFIQTSGNRMKKLIEDILEFSKVANHNGSTNEVEQINLNDLVNEISELVVSDQDNKSVVLSTDLPSINWNASKIFLLFKNLIENGLKYNESENPSVTLSYSITDAIHTISIEDNGIGIDKKYFDKIFVMFERLHKQSDYDGTGLGLATCKKIVEEFDGKISINSNINDGTVFKIVFPEKMILDIEVTNEVATKNYNLVE